MQSTSKTPSTRHCSKPTKSAVILGGAGCLFDDIEIARAFGPYDAVYAVNDALINYSGIVDCAVTLHPEKLPEWLAGRTVKGWSDPRNIIAERDYKGLVSEIREYRWPGQSRSGSSGFFAAKCAIEDGFTHIVLAGVPMDAEQGHVGDQQPWDEVEMFWSAWIDQRHRLQPHVRSVSGRTASLLGVPTFEWRFGANPTVPEAQIERE